MRIYSQYKQLPYIFSLLFVGFDGQESFHFYRTSGFARISLKHLFSLLPENGVDTPTGMASYISVYGCLIFPEC